MTRGTVLIVSTDVLFADSIRTTLTSTDWVVVGVVEDGVRALSVIARRPPDRVLLLGHPSRLRGETFARQVSRGGHPTTVVMLGLDETPKGALPSDASIDDLLHALEAPIPLRIDVGGAARGVGLLATLTARERTVLGLLARGWSRHEVAAALGVTANTVRTHAQRVYAKLGIHTAADLVRFASRHGLVDANGDPAEDASE